MKHLLWLPCTYPAAFLLLLPLLFAACSSDDDGGSSEPPVSPRRTILVYDIAENSLSQFINADINEMQDGSRRMPADTRLLAFVDDTNGKPYICEMKNGQRTVLHTYDDDFYCTDPHNMAQVFHDMISLAPAPEYAAVIECHGSGPIIRNDTIAATRAIGPDNGDNSYSNDGYWLNIPSLADVFKQLPHMEYIFFDVCCMLNIETCYELRHAATYIIGAPSETPGDGADYRTLVPTLALPTAQVPTSLMTNYGPNPDGTRGLCLAAVKTDALQPLMQATREALATVAYSGSKLELDHSQCIFYYKNRETRNSPALHDMKCVMFHNLQPEAFQAWLPALERAIVAVRMPQGCQQGDGTPYWATGLDLPFRKFRLDAQTYSGISMIVPDEVSYAETKSYPSINRTMFCLEWAHAVGWQQYGWQPYAPI